MLLFEKPPCVLTRCVENLNTFQWLCLNRPALAGDAVILCDNRIGEWACKVIEAGKRTVVLEPVEHLRPRENVPDLWLCPALLKKDRFDLVLEKATELGAARIEVAALGERAARADSLSQQRDVPPCSAGDMCPPYPSGGPARYVLELNAGQAEKLKLETSILNDQEGSASAQLRASGYSPPRRRSCGSSTRSRATRSDQYPQGCSPVWKSRSSSSLSPCIAMGTA